MSFEKFIDIDVKKFMEESDKIMEEQKKKRDTLIDEKCIFPFQNKNTILFSLPDDDNDNIYEVDILLLFERCGNIIKYGWNECCYKCRCCKKRYRCH